MLRSFEHLRGKFSELGYEVETPEITQVLSEEELIKQVPQVDGWIIGDDPASVRVFEAGKKGKLKAAVKWGVGVDNVDFLACKRLGIPICNTPQMFGKEVADIAMGYVIALARETFAIDAEVKTGGWPKPAGISLAGKKVGLVGLGDIGQNTAKRLLAADMRVIAYDPFFQNQANDLASLKDIEITTWPKRLSEMDFLIFTCALTPENHHMLNEQTLAQCKKGVRVINVARGPLIDEAALANALKQRCVYSAALDVFEVEPLPKESPLRQYPRCIFGSHNASNTLEAVLRTSERALILMDQFLKGVCQQFLTESVCQELLRDPNCRYDHPTKPVAQEDRDVLKRGSRL